MADSIWVFQVNKGYNWQILSIQQCSRNTASFELTDIATNDPDERMAAEAAGTPWKFRALEFVYNGKCLSI